MLFYISQHYYSLNNFFWDYAGIKIFWRFLTEESRWSRLQGINIKTKKTYKTISRLSFYLKFAIKDQRCFNKSAFDCWVMLIEVTFNQEVLDFLWTQMPTHQTNNRNVQLFILQLNLLVVAKITFEIWN